MEPKRVSGVPMGSSSGVSTVAIGVFQASWVTVPHREILAGLSIGIFVEGLTDPPGGPAWESDHPSCT